MSRPKSLGAALLAAAALAPSLASAQAITKAATGTDLTLGTTWVGGFAPSSTDVATWSGLSLGGSSTIGSNLSWQGIDVRSATSAISISGAGTLTLGGSGITIASGGANLTLSNARTFGATSGVVVGLNRTLAFSSGTTTFDAGTTTTFSGSGTVDFGGSSHVVTGSGNIVIDGVSFFNNLQSGSLSSAFGGAVTLKSGVYRISTSLELLGTGTLTIQGGAIGSGNGTGRTISNALVIDGNFSVGERSGALGLSTGAITFSNTGTINLGSQARTITANSNITIAGALTGNNLVKAGGGTLTLSGSIESTRSLTMAGGGFSYTKAAVQTINGLVLNVGASTITNGNTGTTNKLNLGAITRTAGGLANFSSSTATNNVVTTTNTNTNGILGAWATAGSNWAAVDGSGNILAYAAYTDVARFSGVIANTAANNVRIIDGGTSGNITLAATTTAINTLLQGATAGPAIVTVAAGSTLRTQGVMVIAGAGALTIGATAGTGALTAASAGGELILRNNSAVTASPTLTVNSVIANHTSASSLTIQGSGVGSGIIFLAGNNTYSGGTTLVGTAFLQLGHNNALGSGPVAFSNADIFRLTSNGADRTLSNSVTLGGEGGLRLGSTSAGFTGAFTFSGNFSMGGGVRQIDAAQDLTISGAVSNGGLYKNGAYALTLSNAANSFSGGLWLNSGTLNINSPTALGTGTFTISGSATINNTTGTAVALSTDNVQVWNADFTFAGGSNLNLGAGAVSLGASRTLTVNGATLIVGGVISGAGFGVTKAGAGALSLSGANTFTGGVTLNAGTLNINSAAALGTGTLTIGGAATINNTSGSAVTLSTDNLQVWNADFAFTGSASLNLGAGAVTLGANRTVTVNGSSLVVGGAIAGSGLGLTKAGLGTLVLTGANTYSGGTSISAGTVQVGNGATSGSLGTGAVVNNGQLAFARSDEATVANDISGSGSLVQSGAGTLVLTGTNSYVGTIISAGTLQVGDGGATGTLGSGSVTNNSALAFNRSNAASFASDIAGSGAVSNSGSGTLTLSGAISSSGSLTQSGNGTLVLSGANSYGATTISGGVLRVGAGGAAGTLGTGAVSNDASLVFNRSDSLSVANVISGSGTVTQSGPGTVTLSAANTYAGATLVSAGTLSVTGSLAAQSAVSVESGATLAGSGTVSGAVTLGSGSVLSTGASGVGTLTLGSLVFGRNAADTSTVAYGIVGIAGSASLASGLRVDGDITVNSGPGGVTFAFGNSLANLAGGTVEAPVVYDLITYGGAQLEDISAFAYTGATGARQNVSLFNGTKSIQLRVAAAFPIWKGSTTDWSGAAAWRLNSNSSDTAFLANDTVLFDDTAASGSVNLTSDVAPISVAFANDSLDYEVGSAGGFGITSGSLLKSGSATLTLTGSHGFGGGTTLAAGRIRIGSDTALGSGVITASGGALSSDGATDRSLANGLSLSGTVTLGDLADTGRLAFSGAVAVSGAAALNLVVDAALSGEITGDVLTKSGNGALTLHGSSSHAGVTLDSGRLRAGADSALGSGTLTLRGGSLSSVGLQSRSIANAVSLAGDVALGDAADSGALTFSGGINLGGGSRTLAALSAVTVSSAISNGSLVKSGSGPLTVSGSNSLGVATTISQGTLVLGSAGSVSDTAALTVAADGTLDLGGFSETTGAVTLSGGAITNGTLISALTASSGTFSAVLAGNGSLTKTGNGTLVLSTANTYSGATTVSAGTLQVGSGGTVGSIGSGAVTNSGTLAFNRSDAVTVANAISGTGALSLGGGGAFTLSVANSHQGGTSLVSGTLSILNNAALGSGTFSIVGGAFGSDGNTRTLANAVALGGNVRIGGAGLGAGAVVIGGTVDLGGSTRVLDVNPTAIVTNVGAGVVLNGVVSNGGITKDGAGTLTVLNNGNTFAGPTTVNAGRLVIHQRAVAASSSITLAGTSILTLTENGVGTHDISNFSGASGTSVATDWNITGTATARTLNVNQSLDGTFAGGFTQGTGARVISLVKSGAAVLTLTGSANSYTGTTTVGAGTLAIGEAGRINGGAYAGAIAIAAGATLRFDSTANQTLSGVITGDGILRKTSTGNLTLSGASSFGGRIEVDAGRLILTENNSLAAAIVIGNGGILQVGNNSAGGFIGNSATVSNSGAIEWNRNNATNVATVISGSGTLTKLGADLLSLNADNSLSGTVTIGAGTLRLGEGGASGSIGSGAVVNNATLAFNRSDTLVLGNQVSGAGNVSQVGSGTTVLTGANTYTGTTTIAAGTLKVGAGGTAGSLGSGNVTNNGVLAFDRSDDISVSNVISGTGSLTKLGSGTLTLSGLNAFSGGVTVSAGTLKAADPSAFGTGVITLSQGVTLDFDFLDVANVVVLNGGSLINVRQNGTVSVGGTVTSEYLSTVAASTVTLAPGATADLSGVSKEIVVAGASTLTGLAGFSGNLRVTAGVLDLSDPDNRPVRGVGGSFPGTVEVGGGAGLDFGTADYDGPIVYKGGTITGAFTGNLNVAGTGVALTAGAIEGGKVVVATANSVAIGAGFGRTVRLEGGSVTSGIDTFAGTVELGSAGALNLTTDLATSAAIVVDNGGVLRGTGTVASLTVASGGLLAPGNSPGMTTTTGNLVLLGGGALDLEILSTGGEIFEPVAGGDYDSVTVGGDLDLTALTLENRFLINVISLLDPTTPGQVGDFDPALTKVYDVYAYSGELLKSYAGSATDLFQLDASEFIVDGLAIDPLVFSLVHNSVDKKIQLVYAPIPEPSTYGLILGGLALAGAAIRRRRKAAK